MELWTSRVVEEVVVVWNAPNERLIFREMQSNTSGFVGMITRWERFHSLTCDSLQKTNNWPLLTPESATKNHSCQHLLPHQSEPAIISPRVKTQPLIPHLCRDFSASETQPVLCLALTWFFSPHKATDSDRTSLARCDFVSRWLIKFCPSTFLTGQRVMHVQDTASECPAEMWAATCRP